MFAFKKKQKHINHSSYHPVHTRTAHLGVGQKNNICRVYHILGLFVDKNPKRN